MKCADIQLIISQKPDVTDEEVSAFEAHVAHCPICHAALVQLQIQTDDIFKVLSRSESRPSPATLNAIRSSLSVVGGVSSGFQPRRRLQVVLTSLPRLVRPSRLAVGAFANRPRQIAFAALVMLVLLCGVARLGLRQTGKQPIVSGGTATAINSAVADGIPTPNQADGLSPVVTITPRPNTDNPLISSPTPDLGLVTSTVGTTPRTSAPRPDDRSTVVPNPLPTITRPVAPTGEIPTSQPPTAQVPTIEVTQLPITPVPTAVGTTVPPTAPVPTTVGTTVPPTVPAPTAIGTTVPPTVPAPTTVGTTVPPTVPAPTAIGTTVPPTVLPPTVTVYATLVPPTVTVYATLGPPTTTAIGTTVPPTSIVTPTDTAVPTATPTSMAIPTDTPIPTATPTSVLPPPTPTPTPSGRGLPTRKNFLFILRRIR